MIFAVTDFAAHGEIMQQNVISEHTLNVVVQLFNGINAHSFFEADPFITIFAGFTGLRTLAFSFLFGFSLRFS